MRLQAWVAQAGVASPIPATAMAARTRMTTTKGVRFRALWSCVLLTRRSISSSSAFAESYLNMTRRWLTLRDVSLEARLAYLLADDRVHFATRRTP
jgi:hypothetical protein